MSATARPGLISVPICVFNGERYLAEAIESVLQQTYRPIELIVVDDGSTDRSGEIARDYGGRLDYIWQEHAGTGAARNRGLTQCRGEYVAFQDADDVWMPEKLALQHQALLEHPRAGMAAGLVQQFVSPELDPQDFGHVAIPSRLVSGHVLPSVLVRRAVFDRVGPFAEGWAVGQCLDWFMRYRETGLDIVEIPTLVLMRRIHRENSGFRVRSAQWQRLQILKRGLDRRRLAAGQAQPDRTVRQERHPQCEPDES